MNNETPGKEEKGLQIAVRKPGVKGTLKWSGEWNSLDGFICLRVVWVWGF